MLPADKVPVPTAIAFVTLPVGAVIVTAPLTVRLLAPLRVILVAEFPLANEMEAAAAAAVTVTAFPSAMVTVSLTPGMPAVSPGPVPAPAHPPATAHVVSTFHAELALEVHATAFAFAAPPNNPANDRNSASDLASLLMLCSTGPSCAFCAARLPRRRSCPHFAFEFSICTFSFEIIRPTREVNGSCRNRVIHAQLVLPKRGGSHARMMHSTVATVFPLAIGWWPEYCYSPAKNSRPRLAWGILAAWSMMPRCNRRV